jgi:hypothetical protein
VSEAPIRTVTIPGSAEHLGVHRVDVRLRWVCPICEGPRGEPVIVSSFDRGRGVSVHAWSNACGHIDDFTAVRMEARFNGLQTEELAEPGAIAWSKTRLPEGVLQTIGVSRVETGPLQVGHDWPGVFVRGEMALFYAHKIGAGLTAAGNSIPMQTALDLNALAQLLASCAGLRRM